MNKLDIYLGLFKRHYILHFNKKVVVTNKFHREFSLEEMQAPLRESAIEQIAVEELPKPKYNLLTFILEAEVPEKLHLSSGSFYWANRYSERANKVFLKIMKEGIDYDLLVQATKLYYKSGGARVTIANFITDGIWRSCYESLKTHKEKGTTEKFIKKSISEGDEGFSRYK